MILITYTKRNKYSNNDHIIVATRYIKTKKKI